MSLKERQDVRLYIGSEEGLAIKTYLGKTREGQGAISNDLNLTQVVKNLFKSLGVYHRKRSKKVKKTGKN